MSRDEEYRALVEEILHCRRCGLWETRTNAVPGEGPIDAKVMLIGEAPGRHEDAQGRPFVGAAGKLLTELLEMIGLRRSNVYITNLLKCRPPGNRDPLPDEVEACSPYLDRQVELIRPRVIVTLGRHSTKYVLERGGLRVRGISQVRGRVFSLELNGLVVRVVPTYHPAAALYNPKVRGILERDFEVVRREVEAALSGRRVTLEDFL